MKRFWRVTALLLTLAMILPLIACSSQGGDIEVPTSEETTTEEQPEVTKAKKKKFELVEHTMGEIAGDILILGERTYIEDGALTVNWPCSGFEIKFESPEGTDFAFSLDTNYQNYIKVIVDGTPINNRFAISSKTEKKTVARGLEPGVHVIRVLKDGQIGTAAGNYCKFTAVHLEGTILHTENDPKPLYLEFIGDSIWCGGGALGNTANSSTFANETSGSAAVPYLTAQAMNADYNVTARGSIGVFSRFPTENGKNMLELFPLLNGYRDDTPYTPRRTPDAVIICLGTNDPKSAAGDFVRDGKTFIREIREVYGKDVPIVWTYGMMNRLHFHTELEMIQKAMGGEENGIYLLQLKYGQNGSGSGADNRHPSAADHEKNVEILVPYLKDLLHLS
ncbi:MAG: hypothetical protein J6Z79_01630 [Clostridia bacterium]|nr:hypothetical protein [Clostridia bacterium]